MGSAAVRATQTVPMLNNENRFKLAVFGLNVSGGLSATAAEGVLKGGDWSEVKRLAIQADEAGFDALIPIARWKGYGGKTNWNDRCFETFTWAAALAAITKRIQVFATVQVPTVHPIRAAKEAATVDHISNGRFGLNLVAGWNEDELRMFGLGLKPLEQRYEIAGEFAAFLKRLWTEDTFDFNGAHYRAVGAHGAPHPIQAGGPLLMSAGGSPAGSLFAAEHADIQFLNLQTQDGAAPLVAKLKDQARRKFRRELKVMTCVYIMCRDTEKEAHEYFEYVVNETGDKEAARNMLGALVPTSSFKLLPSVIEHVCAGFGAIPLIGTPEQIVDNLVKLADAGLDGAALSWIDYQAGMEQYQNTLLPMLRTAGLRGPVDWVA